MKSHTLDLALIRWSVTCQSWGEMATGHAPQLGAFLAGWFMRVHNAPMPARENLGDAPDSFRKGYQEADIQIVIEARDEKAS